MENFFLWAVPCAPRSEPHRRGGTRRRAPTQIRPGFASDRDGLLVFFVGVVLLRATGPLNPSTKRLVSAPLPVLSLAGLIAISGLASTTPFLVVVGQWGGAGGAICEHFFGLCALVGLRSAISIEKPEH